MATQTCHYYVWWSQLMPVAALETLQAREELANPAKKPASKKSKAKGGSKKTKASKDE
jgi:hypothetical protein